MNIYLTKYLPRIKKNQSEGERNFIKILKGYLSLPKLNLNQQLRLTSIRRFNAQAC